MLVLSRFADEKILIDGGRIVVIVCGVNRESGKVRIGIQAPPEVTIDREEVAADVAREGRRRK